MGLEKSPCPYIHGDERDPIYKGFCGKSGSRRPLWFEIIPQTMTSILIGADNEFRGEAQEGQRRRCRKRPVKTREK
ncbi:MAG: hypothetical protein CM1200mP15_16500 [Dehalococcoidia bacterium]|nr:MAG: hypothetical protein CM1200mP15_16500 [Dehalococcoidia bacterium]